MPMLEMLPKGHAKAQLSAFFDKLKHACANKPRLTAALKAESDKWAADLDKVPDSNEPLAQPVNQNDNEAFINRIKTNAKAHDDLLGRLQDMMNAETPYGRPFLTKLSKARGKVEQDVRQWDLQQANYDREVNAYAQRNQEKQSAYHETLKELRRRLEAMRVQYNRSFMFEERLDDDSRSQYFLNDGQCGGYVPAQHCWKSLAGKYTDKQTGVETTGTYIYDFRQNEFQLHIHCNPHDGDVKAIRVKLYTEEHGKYSNLKTRNAAIAAVFRKAYPPDGSGLWVQVG